MARTTWNPLSTDEQNSIEFSYAQIRAALNAVNSVLSAWAASSAYTLTSATRDSDDVITVATVAWPDGSAGTFTTTTKNATFLLVDAYTVTHLPSGKTVTQAAVTRNAAGSITAQPALVVS